MRDDDQYSDVSDYARSGRLVLLIFYFFFQFQKIDRTPVSSRHVGLAERARVNAVAINFSADRQTRVNAAARRRNKTHTRRIGTETTTDRAPPTSLNSLR